MGLGFCCPLTGNFAIFQNHAGIADGFPDPLALRGVRQEEFAVPRVQIWVVRAKQTDGSGIIRWDGQSGLVLRKDVAALVVEQNRLYFVFNGMPNTLCLPGRTAQPGFQRAWRSGPITMQEFARQRLGGIGYVRQFAAQPVSVARLRLHESSDIMALSQ